MTGLTRKLTQAWTNLGPAFFPFADVVTPDLTLSRLFRLSLFQVSVGLALVLLVGTLNRVMIVELGIPASIVGIMIALPLVFAPFRALIGHKSDTHRCELGWRRTPFIYRGTMLQFGGFAVMPFALLVLAGKGEAVHAPAWIGQVSAAIAFLLVGAGVHTVQTAGLALATDLTPPESHPKVVGLMYVMLLVGMIISALVYGAALVNFNPGRLVQVIQGAALATVVLNGIALWKQEARRRDRKPSADAVDPTFAESWAHFSRGEHAIRRLVVVGVGTMAFGMADILLEPFGGQVLAMNVAATTRLTALLAFGGLLGFAYATFVIGRGMDALRVARTGAWIGLPAFVFVMGAKPLDMLELFLLGNFLIGFGGALFGHGTLTATMNRAPRDQAGLALGAWGAVQATAAGVGVAISGVLRDAVNAIFAADSASALGYLTVYSLEITLLVITIVAAWPLVRGAPRRAMEPVTTRTAG